VSKAIVAKVEILVSTSLLIHADRDQEKETDDQEHEPGGNEW